MIRLLACEPQSISWGSPIKRASLQDTVEWAVRGIVQRLWVIKVDNICFKDHWQFGTQVAIAHTAQAAAFVLHQARIGTGAMNKFGTSFQLSDDLFFTIK